MTAVGVLVGARMLLPAVRRAGLDVDAVFDARLTQVTHVDTFWFAWAAFLPDTEVVPPVS